MYNLTTLCLYTIVLNDYKIIMVVARWSKYLNLSQEDPESLQSSSSKC